MGALCAFLQLWIISILLGIVIVLCYANTRVCFQMYDTYKHMSVRLQGKNLTERLNIIYENSYIWLMYASFEEINRLRKFFDQMSSSHPEYGRVKELVECSYYKC